MLIVIACHIFITSIPIELQKSTKDVELIMVWNILSCESMWTALPHYHLIVWFKIK